MGLKNLLYYAILFIFLALISFASATTTLESPLTTYNYSTTLNFTCVTDLANAINATLWLNASGTTPNISLVTVTNTSEGQTLFVNASVDISSLDDLATYGALCQIFNLTGSQENSSVTLDITVDNTAPVVTLPVYLNGSANKNTNSLTLNISVTDATSGLLNSFCLVDINGTNQSFAVSNGWCNFSVGNLTGLSDGNQTINIYVNDSTSNLALNNSFVVQVDTTAPVASSSCSPSSVHLGESVVCGCSGTDATSGVNSSLVSSGVTYTTSSTGTYSYTCSVTDYAGNSHSVIASYSVTGSNGGIGGGSGSITGFWTAGTHSVSDDAFSNGFDYSMPSRERVRVSIANEYHYIGVVEIKNDNSIVINISSTPQTATLLVGDERKFDANEDGFYDIYVKLISIKNGEAEITIKSIYEEVTEESEQQQKDLDNGAAGDILDNGSNSKIFIWIVVILIILIIVGSSLYRNKKVY